MACALEESQLMVRESGKNLLISLISNEDDRQLVISVCGMGGIGKTTLVKEAYLSQKLSGLFEKRAWVTIMRPFVLSDVLKSLAMQLREEFSNNKNNIDIGLGTTKITETKLLAEELVKLTERKRCLIVLDDLSSVVEWGMIIQSLPKMENASRIVITTREENIAKHCSEKLENIYKLGVLSPWDSLRLFTKKVFNMGINWDQHPALKEEAIMILKKCNELPLAIVTIGGFLAKQPKTPIAWRKMNEHISAELEMNPELGIIRTILMKSYDGLPYYLKSCFLYMSIFPEDDNVSRRRLVSRWNAEGYSCEVRGMSLGEVADSYFVELIERSMILPSKESIGSRKGISSCKVHDLMREISISKAMEENLVFRMEEGCSLNTQGTIRHLAISTNWEGDQNEFECIVDLSRIRSITVFGKWKQFYISDKMKLLRVLDLEGTSDIVGHHLEPIMKLLHLKYLSLRGCDRISYLPESLGNLKQLETLDVTNTRIIKLPQAITKLKKLQYFRAGMMYNPIISMREIYTLCCCEAFVRPKDPHGIAVPKGLRKLKALQTLGMVNIERGKATVEEIKRLTQLQKLVVTSINKKNCQEFCSTLVHLSSLESLSVHSCEEEGLRDCLDSLPTPPKSLQSLKLYGTLGKLPEWVAGLQNLVKLKLQQTEVTDLDSAIQVLGKLPNLVILRLLGYSFKAEEPHHLSCPREAFPSLRVLETGTYTGIKSVLFEIGTAPKLELLLSRDDISFSGLSWLPSLKEVMIPEFPPFVGDVKDQLSLNPNKPILKFLGAELRM